MSSSLPSVNSRMGRTAYLKAATLASDPPVETISDISDYVSLFKSKREKQMCLNKYRKAEETKVMMEQFSNRAQTALYDRRCQNEITDFDDRLNSTKTNEKELEESTKARLSRFEEEAEMRLNSMKSRHQRELDEHKAMKPSDLPAKYRKRSSDLINLYRIERKLSLDNKVAEAKMIREEINKKEEIESKKMMDMAIKSWKVAGEHLVEKQRKELEAMIQKLSTRRQEENQETSVMRESIEKRELLLTNHIGGVKNLMQQTTPQAKRRALFFSSTPSMKTRSGIIPNLSKDVYTLASSLPKRSREILSSL